MTSKIIPPFQQAINFTHGITLIEHNSEIEPDFESDTPSTRKSFYYKLLVPGFQKHELDFQYIADEHKVVIAVRSNNTFYHTEQYECLINGWDAYKIKKGDILYTVKLFEDFELIDEVLLYNGILNSKF